MAAAPSARAVLLDGPAAGTLVDVAGPTVVVGTHLYELTDETAEVGRRQRRVYRHRADCCDPGDADARRRGQDGCE
ncbi:hypothetical protein [Micromonospora sp. NPDC049679]|uniref:hypothetical protein n=1 Tax=Micromonospora sp. NPDC049679 TaxID=3155920 RepID=UPI003404CF11